MTGVCGLQPSPQHSAVGLWSDHPGMPGSGCWCSWHGNLLEHSCDTQVRYSGVLKSNWFLKYLNFSKWIFIEASLLLNIVSVSAVQQSQSVIRVHIWHHWLNGHEFEQAPGDGEGQGSLVCFSPWSHRELDMTERLSNKYIYLFPFYFGFPSPLGHHRAVSRVPCAKQ